MQIRIWIRFAFAMMLALAASEITHAQERFEVHPLDAVRLGDSVNPLLCSGETFQPLCTVGNRESIPEGAATMWLKSQEVSTFEQFLALSRLNVKVKGRYEAFRLDAAFEQMYRNARTRRVSTFVLSAEILFHTEKGVPAFSQEGKDLLARYEEEKQEQYLIADHGAGVVTSVTQGGRLLLVYHCEFSSEDVQKRFHSKIRAALDGIGSIEGEIEREINAHREQLQTRLEIIQVGVTADRKVIDAIRAKPWDLPRIRNAVAGELERMDKKNAPVVFATWMPWTKVDPLRFRRFCWGPVHAQLNLNGPRRALLERIGEGQTEARLRLDLANVLLNHEAAPVQTRKEAEALKSYLKRCDELIHKMSAMSDDEMDSTFVEEVPPVTLRPEQLLKVGGWSLVPLAEEGRDTDRGDQWFAVRYAPDIQTHLPRVIESIVVRGALAVNADPAVAVSGPGITHSEFTLDAEKVSQSDRRNYLEGAFHWYVRAYNNDGRGKSRVQAVAGRIASEVAKPGKLMMVVKVRGLRDPFLFDLSVPTVGTE